MEGKYYRVIVECGHVGYGRTIEITRNFKAFDIISCYTNAFYMPRSKKRTGCIKLVRPISYAEYITGKDLESENYYLKKRK